LPVEKPEEPQLLLVPFPVDKRRNDSNHDAATGRGIQQMIDHYSDHAANERTFLAWVRTAIAVMAFGFLVAKFNLFLKIAAQSLAGAHGRSVSVPGGGFGDVAGLTLIVAGTAMVAMAAVRFIRTGRAIDAPERRPGGARMDLALSALMVILGIALTVYVSHALFA
jgi:putative membrane protein